MAERDSGQRLREDLLRLLADPRQEVLIERRPAFSQLAPVPLPAVAVDRDHRQD